MGADLPINELVAYAADVEPDMIILSAVFEYTASPLYKMQASLNQIPSQPKLGFGGRYVNENEKARNELDGVFLGTDLDQAIHNVHKLLD